MFSWKNFPDKPIVIAHRGASLSAPENTLAAFKKAIDDGTHAIEFDVRLSKDREVVVIHDSRLERTSSGRGKVADYCLKELQSFDSGSWFSSKYSREFIPSLEQVFELVKKKVGINIEIKSLSKGQSSIVENCVRIIKDFNLQKLVMISSFDHAAIRKVKSFDKSIKTGIIYSPVIHFRKNPSKLALKYDADAFVISRNYLRDTMIDEAHKNKLLVFVYKIDNRQHLERMINSEVDGVITSSPRSMRFFLSNK